MDLSLKMRIMSEIEKNVDIFRKESKSEFRIRCPICGDSEKNPTDSHCYLKCSIDPNEPILYNCFLCNSCGKVDSKFLNLLHIKSELSNELDNQRYNKITSIKNVDIDIMTGSPIMGSKQTSYIEYRLGTGFNVNDYDRFKIIWNMSSIYNYIPDIRIRNTLPNINDSICFLSDDKSMLLIRSFTNDGRWKKVKLFPSENRSFYTIKSTFNLFTKDDIIVNIAEGVFDILSIYKNFNDGENSTYVAVLGSDYMNGVDYAISKGLFGFNVVLKIYIDNDISESKLKYQLKKYKWIFKKIYIYKNIKSKDVGVKIKDIKLIEFTV